jgi:Leucine-rich repeat (LRR) protein
MINSNHLEGMIPPDLGKIPATKILTLQLNNLSGVFPPSLESVNTDVALSNCQHATRKHSYQHWCLGDKLPDMQSFELSHNRFSGVIPSSLFNLSSLIDVYLDTNKFTGSVPSTVGRLQSLSSLSLYSNRLDANNKMGWEFITSLTNCSRLQHLTIADNSFTVGSCQARL